MTATNTVFIVTPTTDQINTVTLVELATVFAQAKEITFVAASQVFAKAQLALLLTLKQLNAQLTLKVSRCTVTTLVFANFPATLSLTALHIRPIRASTATKPQTLKIICADHSAPHKQNATLKQINSVTSDVQVETANASGDV